jgi:hypothetical protein
MNEGTLRPFLASFAKAALNMPSLKHAVLWSNLGWDLEYGDNDNNETIFDYFEPSKEWYPNDMAWGIQYSIPGEVSN